MFLEDLDPSDYAGSPISEPSDELEDFLDALFN